MEKKLQRLQKEVSELRERCTRTETKEEAEKKCKSLEDRCRTIEVDGKNLRRQVDGLWKRCKEIADVDQNMRNKLEEKLENKIQTLQTKVEALDDNYRRMEEKKNSEIEELNRKLYEEKKNVQKMKTEMEKERKHTEVRLAALEKLVGTKGTLNQVNTSTSLNSLKSTLTPPTTIDSATVSNSLPSNTQQASLQQLMISPHCLPNGLFPIPKETSSPTAKAVPEGAGVNSNHTRDKPSNSPFRQYSMILRDVPKTTSQRSKSPRAPSKATPNSVRSRADMNASLIDAAAKGDWEIVRLLLASGANANVVNMSGNTPLHLASKQGHASVANVLLTAGAKVNSTSSGGMTPLHTASVNGHVSVIALLLNHDASVNCKTAFSETPLHCAAANGRVSAVQLLLSAGADACALNNRAQTPLDQAESDEIRRILKKHIA